MTHSLEVAVDRRSISFTLKGETVIYWVVTAFFCLQETFTVYAQLRLPQVAEAFTHLGFPDYFRVELAWAKFLGVLSASATLRRTWLCSMHLETMPMRLVRA